MVNSNGLQTDSSYGKILYMKNTIIKKINKDNLKKEEFEEAAAILKNGGLVAFPTETVYGLGGDGLREEAAKKIYAAKGRPSDNPLIIHIADMESLGRLAATVPNQAKQLADRFWPGPLTMIFKKKKEVPAGTTGGLNTVAVRMPGHPVALALIRYSGICIAAPSANTSGRPSPTRASHVMDDLSGRIDMILDGGEVEIGIESTIVDMSGEQPVILRPGYITRQMMEEVIGPVGIDPAVLTRTPDPAQKPKAPGMKYKHYAPSGDLTIFEGSQEAVAARINAEAAKQLQRGKKVGIIAAEESCPLYHYGTVKIIGTRREEATIARHLFQLLREFDEMGIDYIYSESFASDNLGQAIMNRLLKAAGYQIVSLEGGREDGK